MRSMFSLLIMSLGVVSWSAQADTVSECQRTCSRQCMNYAREMSRAADMIFSSCGGGGAPPPYPGPGQVVELFRSDSCSSDLVASVNTYTDCNSIPGSHDSVWGLRVEGQCYNIADMTLGEACYTFRDMSDPYAVAFYRSDSCRDEMMAVVSRVTSCEEIDRALRADSVWGIRRGLNGSCQDIADTDFLSACKRFAR